jgi:hypothetical protein
VKSHWYEWYVWTSDCRQGDWVMARQPFIDALRKLNTAVLAIRGVPSGSARAGCIEGQNVTIGRPTKFEGD